MKFLRRLGNANAAEPSWWAPSGTPPQQGNMVTPLIDGHQTMLAMCRAFLAARSSIVMAAWDILVDLPLVRGADCIATPDGTDAERANHQALLTAGLSQEAVTFWNTHDLTVRNVLAFAIQHGVAVKLLLWDAPGLAHLTNDPHAQAEALRGVGVDVLLDDSCRNVTSAVRALHQKCTIVDSSIAFVGGVDLTSQDTGDYDRWDTNHHPFTSDARVLDTLPGAHPWHDLHTRIEGPAVGDVLANVAQRWDDVAMRHGSASWPAALTAGMAGPLRDGVTAQIVRTIPPDVYPTVPQGVSTIYELYRGAIRQARESIYIESQYFWRDVFLGIDSQLWGPHSPHMLTLIGELGAALRRGVDVTIILPDHPNTGRAYTDGGIETLRKQSRGRDRDHLSVFTLGVSELRQDAVAYRPVYVHAKLCIIDDTWWTAGSANFNSRGMHGDAEINVAVVDPQTASGLRIALWDEHAHPSPGELAQLHTARSGVRLLKQRAAENASLVNTRQPLHGHVLPYFTYREATARGLAFSREHGWLDALDGVKAPRPHHAGRYL